ncbi:signal peptide peptidase SppA, partial [Brucella melitensis]
RDLILHAGARLLGLPQEADGAIKEIARDRIFLDGLLSVWHVDGIAGANPANQ